MIRILAVTLRRQINSTIFKPQKSKITFGYEGVFRQFRPGGRQRSFCYCASGPIKAADDAVEYPLELNPPPAFIAERDILFDRLKAEYDVKIEAKEKTPIKITLRDGKVVDGLAWKTTPYEIASSISQGLADNTVVCKVNGEVFDLDRVLEGDCTLEFLKFEDDEAKAVFWHSSAHIMGEAMERHYGGHLCYGPPIEEGYYYDMFLDGRQVSSNDYSSLDTLTKNIVKEKQPFVRLEISKEDLLVMFKYNEFKCRIIREKVKTPTTTVYNLFPAAKAVFWHSSAHIMGEAMERHYGGHLCYGPPIEEGYYYDMFLDGRQVSSNDYSSLDTLTKNIVKEKQPFVRLEISKEDLLVMFKYNEFKCRIIREKVKTPTTTVYKCGPLIDLCRGPHVRHTGKIKAMQVTKNSATYWEGNCEAESLQRLYGISFPNDKQMKEWKKFQEEAAKRDHRKLGRDHELFFFHELSPGSCFFLPKGAHIYNSLINFIKEEYNKRGFQEVISPNIYSTKLWETSGHWQHYSENMFSFEVEKERYALKPMNCPGHCVMFDHRPRSWRELPLRMADFGVLHRNELSGTLTGLTRVRRFQQDDAHLFCRPDQIGDEIKGCLDFLKFVYSKFGFSFKLFLSTRPDKYMGKLELWDSAEKELEKSLNEFGMPWTLNPGDGAFYGPKVQ
ncbi:threonine--tRNA ligase, cytoplasmic-like [Orbicella faveolata]|uniref:threonine--tRNA ligase, cytoplasmic-like n=1 Tax=Orbicella faveolata TaxID=48498 RepID=UPI0009E36710|nr:threonine--tRNA ligase, cytoplasmic-like [Orbicella faveolata]